MGNNGDSPMHYAILRKKIWTDTETDRQADRAGRGEKQRVTSIFTHLSM